MATLAFSRLQRFSQASACELLVRAVRGQRRVGSRNTARFPTACGSPHLGGPQSAAGVSADTGQHLVYLVAMSSRQIVQTNDFPPIHMHLDS
jgi:hypothetical protein